MSEPGNEKVRRARGASQPLGHVTPGPGESIHGLPPGCPVIPLGLLGDVRYYLDAKRQLRPLAAGKHIRSEINGLFGHMIDLAYSVERWQRRNPEGNVTGLRPELMAEDLMRACGHAGLWDPTDRERGRGAWRGDGGELILHTGDQISVYGLYDPWGLRIVAKPGLVGRYVYPAGEATAEPAATEPEPGPDPVDRLLELLESWSWRRAELDAVLLLGWIAAAMIGGALTWRPSIWMTGGKGTGKTTLQKLIKDVLGGHLLALTDTTPAGIWQRLGHQTLPVTIDELEATEDNRRSLGIVGLAKIAASGGKMARGGDNHRAVEFTVRSCFAFSSVLVPPLLGTERSRLAMLELDELPEGAALAPIDETALAASGAQMRRRLVTGWNRFDETVAYYRAALTSRSDGQAGHTERAADQFGTLLACADIALWPGGTNLPVAAGWLARMTAHDLAETVDEQRDEMQCWQHLLGCPIDPFRRGDRVNLGEWLNRAAGRAPDYDDPRVAQRVLQGYGIRFDVVPARSDEAQPSKWIAVANSHSGLASLFERTRWSTPRGVSGVWAQALRRLPGAERSTGALYFGGPVSKATMLPIALLPTPDRGAGPHPFDPETDPTS